MCYIHIKHSCSLIPDYIMYGKSFAIIPLIKIISKISSTNILKYILKVHSSSNTIFVFILENLKKYLLTRDIKSILENVSAYQEEVVQIDYDIPTWLSSTDNNLQLKDFNTSGSFVVKLPRAALEELDNIEQMNKDLVLSLQILYRDGTIRGFWPEWCRQIVS